MYISMHACMIVCIYECTYVSLRTTTSLHELHTRTDKTFISSLNFQVDAVPQTG